MKELNYNGDLQIDHDALDVEWLRQASLFMKYAIEATEARTKLDRAKERLDVVRAELGMIVRNELAKTGGKTTEAVVNSAIIQKSAYQDATEDVIQKKYDMDLLISAVKAFDQRKDALENLVRLQGQQYFAGPSEPRDLGGEVDRIRRRKHEAVAERIKNKKGKQA